MSDPVAYKDGFAARLAGKELADNPYPPFSFTAQHRAWADGWWEQDRHLKDRDEALASIGWFG